MRKPAFCIRENKGADQLHCNCAADLHLCFGYIDSVTILLLFKTEISSFQPSSVAQCTIRFKLDLVRNPKDRFSNETAHIQPKQVSAFNKTRYVGQCTVSSV